MSLPQAPVSLAGFARYRVGMDEPEKTPQSQHDVESERDRRIANIVLLAFLVVLVGAGIWLANAMVEHRRIDDCMAQGRRNCVPLDVR